jgi:cytochrome c oxidase subunit 3
MARPTTVEEPHVELLEQAGAGGGGPSVPAGGNGGSGGGGQPVAVPRRAYLTGLTLGLAAIFMFFMGLTSAFIVRRGLGNDWVRVNLPPVLWLNTAVLLASSVVLERARQYLARAESRRFQSWWRMGTVLGMLFLAGQLVAWRQLVAQGIYLATNPAASFFYVLTAAHGLHLFGGLVAVVVIALRRWDRSRFGQALAVDLAALYWHFLDGLWIFLFLLLKMGQ